MACKNSLFAAYALTLEIPAATVASTSQMKSPQNSEGSSLVPRPRPAFRRLQSHFTVLISDGKLGGAWERGYEGSMFTCIESCMFLRQIAFAITFLLGHSSAARSKGALSECKIAHIAIPEHMGYVVTIDT